MEEINLQPDQKQSTWNPRAGSDLVLRFALGHSTSRDGTEEALDAELGTAQFPVRPKASSAVGGGGWRVGRKDCGRKGGGNLFDAFLERPFSDFGTHHERISEIPCHNVCV